MDHLRGRTRPSPWGCPTPPGSSQLRVNLPITSGLRRESRQLKTAVHDRSLEVFHCELKHIPTGSAPDRVCDSASPRLDQSVATLLLQQLNHILAMIAMLPDQDVDMIRHDRAAITRILALLNDL